MDYKLMYGRCWHTAVGRKTVYNQSVFKDLLIISLNNQKKTRRTAKKNSLKWAREKITLIYQFNTCEKLLMKSMDSEREREEEKKRELSTIATH